MRSDLSSVNQLTMCMNKPDLASRSPTTTCSIIKPEAVSPELATYPISSSGSSFTSYDDNDIIEFGPIKVKPRKKPAPTLATGRRSKYEILSPEEEQKRDLRRARNRAAADRVRLNRLNVEQKLQYEIDDLEDQEQNLLTNIQMLQNEKLHLETRLFTHRKICPTLSIPNAQSDLMSVFTSTDTPISTTFQLASTTDLDEFLSVSPSPMQQNNYSNSLTTIMPGDDLDEFFMDPC